MDGTSLSITSEVVQCLMQLSPGNLHRANTDNLAFGITGIGSDTQTGCHLIALVRIKEKLGKFSGFTKADRQHTGWLAIQGTSMASFGSAAR